MANLYRWKYECYFCGLKVNSWHTAIAHRCRQNLIGRATFILELIRNASPNVSPRDS